MIKFAPVCPIRIYEGLAEIGPEYIGDYFLLLAHDVVANADRYATFFSKLRETRNVTIIMDNSVIELGNACKAPLLLEACDIVKASCLAIPDVLKDGIGTVDAAIDFFKDWQGNYPLMFIPQGKDQKDFEFCVHTANRAFGTRIDWIGVPRNLTGRVYKSRVLAMDFLINYFDPQFVKYHLLGFSDSMCDDFFTCKHYSNTIEGIDSAVPLRLSYKLGANNDFRDPGPRNDWWEQANMNGIVAHNVLETRNRLK
jgi:hypothetical protein